MAMHTYSDNVLVKSAFAPAALTNGTQNGTSVDLDETSGAPYRRAALVLNLNPGASTTANFQLQDSPDNTTWTNVTGATLGTPVAASTQSTQVVNINAAARQRYVRVQIIGSGATPAGSASAEFHLFEAENLAPTQDATPISV